MGFIILFYFLYCVLSFCYRFLLLLGKRVWVYFSSFYYYFIYFNKKIGIFLLFEGQKGAQAF
jgi:hypothetical protein